MARGLKVTNVHAENEFECTHEALVPVHLNVTTVNEHVGEVERSIHTIKEMSRSTIQGLPYKWYPRLLVTSLI